MIHVGWKHTGEKNKIWPKRKNIQLWNTICCSFKKTQDFLLFFQTLSPFSRLFFRSENCWKLLLSTNPEFLQGISLHNLPVYTPVVRATSGPTGDGFWFFVTIQILEVLLIGESKFLTNQKCYPDLGSDASSVWDFCARFSDVTSRKPVVTSRNVGSLFLRAKLGHLRVEMPHCTWCAYHGTKALRTFDRN